MKSKKTINFFSTTKNRGLYKFLIGSSLSHSSRILNKNIKINFIYKEIPSLRFCLFLIKNFFGGKILNLKKCVNLRYENIELGLYALATTYREPISHRSTFSLFLNLLKYIFLGGSMIDTAKNIINKVDAVYIDHAIYIHGVYFKLFADYKKIIYSNQYPRGLFFIDYNKRNSHVTLPRQIFRLSKKIQIENFKLIKREKLLKFLKNPKNIPWVRSTKFRNKIKNEKFLKDVEYIVYAHSFLDGNISYGYDGFITLEEWLIFTIEYLIKKKSKTIIKAHPNFYNNDFGETGNIDKLIFEKIRERYKFSDLIFINEPINNSELLKKVNKKTILITHHGTIAFEAGLFGYKSINSKCTFWDETFKISNQWSNKKDYSELLNKDWKDLKFANQNDLKIFLSQLFYDYGNFGKKFWAKNFESKIGSNHSFLTHEHGNKIRDKDYQLILNNITKNIHELKYKNDTKK